MAACDRGLRFALDDGAADADARAQLTLTLRNWNGIEVCSLRASELGGDSAKRL